MSAEPEYTTHTRVTVSIPHEDAMKLVRAGVGQTGAADLLDALGAVPKGTPYAEVVTQRAEAAEAKLAKVREVMNVRPMPRDTAAALNRALNPVPPFTLPTEAGAFVSARNEYGDRYEFEMWTNGADSRWMDTSGGYSPLTATELLDEFTDHRLLGADQ